MQREAPNGAVCLGAYRPFGNDVVREIRTSKTEEGVVG